MSSALRYGLMAFGGLVCGLIALVLSASVRGRFAKQLFLHRLIDGFSVFPGIALFLWLAPMGDPSRSLESFQLLGLFMLTYTGTRIIAHKWTKVRSANREQTLPFKHWLELVRTDPPTAHGFLKAYLADRGDRGDRALMDLRVASGDLERRRSEERYILVALDQLRAEIARRQDHAISN